MQDETNPAPRNVVERSDALIAAALAEAVADAELFGAGAPCPAMLEPAGASPKLVLVTGENASGKSFFCRYLGQVLRHAGVEVMPLGMALRTTAGMQRAMVYGNEAEDSTGELSMRSALMGLHNVTGSGGARLLVLDEPDVGLSESFAAALGQRLASFCAAMPADAVGVVVVTHSRAIAAALADLEPWRVRVGNDLRPTAEWLRDGPLPVSPDDIERLFAESLERFRAITRVLDARRAARKTEKDNAKAKRAATAKEAEEGYRADMRALIEPDTTAAARFLVAALDERAAQNDRTGGFALDDGILSWNGNEIGPVELRLQRVRDKLWRVIAKLDWHDAPMALTDDGLDDIWRQVTRKLPSAGRSPR